MTDVAVARPGIEPSAGAGAEPRSYWKTVADRLGHDRLTLAVTALLLLIIGLAVFAPWAATHDPLQGSVLRRLKPVGTPGFFLGTDETGRDIWSRLVYGGRLSLVFGITPGVVAAVMGGSARVMCRCGWRR